MTIVGKYAISDAPPVFMSLSCDLEQHLNSKNFKHNKYIKLVFDKQ